MTSEKITRATFLYMDPKAPEDEFAQCGTCVHFLKKLGRCELLGPKVEIDDDDSCGLYAHGTAEADEVPEALVTPEEAGLVDRQVRCENCKFFDPDSEPREHCDLYSQLNRILPKLFDLDRYVDEYGCCNAQTPGKRDQKVFGPVGPLGEKGEDSDGAVNAVSSALRRLQKGK
jgi:hypothetical protein